MLGVSVVRVYWFIEEVVFIFWRFKNLEFIFKNGHNTAGMCKRILSIVGTQYVGNIMLYQ